MKKDPIQMYHEYVSPTYCTTFDRANLFDQLATQYNINSAIYPGSYIHITPSLYFQKTTYIDTDRRFSPFFNDQRVHSFIEENKKYLGKSEVNFYKRDYRELVDEEINKYDLLISQYAGFVSKYCKEYLNKGGILVVNNSHGDASMAYLDSDYSLIAIGNHRDGKYHISDKDLFQYFIPKKDIPHTTEYLEKIQKGVGYTKTASIYMFQKL
ncbi:hypothetical protein [Bacillus sp. 2205SS5-2]|uniref:hypothetical protein n=1 Tax=Bacillus sp. 2205SS5-2 TaxID=3109031 RepID=UPI00300607E2